MIMSNYDYDNYSFNDDYYDDPMVRDHILREAAEQILWDTPESVPQELLEDF